MDKDLLHPGVSGVFSEEEQRCSESYLGVLGVKNLVRDKMRYM